MQKLIIFALFAVGAVFCADTTPVLPCDTVVAPFNSVQIFTSQGLCPEMPCTFYRGDDVTALITFENLYDNVVNITKKCNVTTGGISLQFPLPNANKGCDDLQDGWTCPLYQGDLVTYKLVMPVSKLYPKVDLSLLMYIEDQFGICLTCFHVDATVADLPKGRIFEAQKPAPMIQKSLRNAETSNN